MNSTSNNAAMQTQQIPEQVQFHVKHALNVLREQEASLHGVQMARGNGHILALELKDREGRISHAIGQLDEFRRLAPKNGVDAEAFIQACGGVPDLSRFGFSPRAVESPAYHEYAFDCTLTAAIRVKASSREAAEALLRAALDAADCNGGSWPNGDPILFEASVNHSEISLYEVDGEQVDDPKLAAAAMNPTTESAVPSSSPKN